MRLLLGMILLVLAPCCLADDSLESALDMAGENRGQLQHALQEVPESRREGMEFLIRYMPERDLTSLNGEFLLSNVRLAYDAWESSNWRDEIPKEVFLNDVLPYASITEKREDWRSDFHLRFADLVKDAQTTSEAVAILNNSIFEQLDVKYSKKRKRADQSPSESIDQGRASCSGLSVILIDACRAVGIPARFVGTPLWSDRSGNHSWVEIYDNGWHFTGACEATGSDLNQGWFVQRAAEAKRDSRIHAIYATSYKKTSVKFPMVWNRKADYVHAINVTDQYTRLKNELPTGVERIMFVAFDGTSDERVSLPLIITAPEEQEIFRGKTHDESFDRNDHISVPLQTGSSYQIQFGETPPQTVKVTGNDQLVVFRTSSPQNNLQATVSDSPTQEDQESASLSKEQANAYLTELWSAYKKSQFEARKRENESREIKIGDKTMPFWYKVFGNKPEGGRRLFISMHGGGSAPPAVNDRQYENQKRLYEPAEGVYFVPRAPTNTWNLWHEGHIDDFFQRVIENMVLLEGVNPNQVYIMGYSAGGDGVFQLAPRMADRLAAAAMMAGHPNETTPDSLRNLPFTIHMGGRDAAYKRNEKAAEWKKMLADLNEKDSGGYISDVTIHEGLGHWVQRRDAVAVPWMSKFIRKTSPDYVVWKQDDRTHNRFYWLAVDNENAKGRTLIRVRHDGQSFDIKHCDVQKLTLRVNDDMVDFTQPVKVTYDGTVLFDDMLERRKSVIKKTFEERHDRTSVFSAEIEVDIPQK